MAFSADQLNEAFAVATSHIRKDITSQLEETNYLYKLMTENKEYVDGGVSIQQPINPFPNKSKGFINGTTDIIDTNTNQQFTFATFDWKYFYQNVSVTFADFVKTANSTSAIESLIEAKRKAAVADTARTLSEAMHGSGSDSSGNAFNGFTDIFAASGTSYGGLLDTDFDNTNDWLTEIDSSSQNVNYQTVAGMIATLKARGNQYGGGPKNPFKPDIAISNSATQQAFMNTLQAQQRFADKETVMSGFEGVKVNNIFWYVDEYASGSADGTTADNYLYILASGTLKLCYKFGWDKKSPMDQTIQLVNQPIKSDQIFFAGNIVCTCRRVNGVFKTLVA